MKVSSYFMWGITQVKLSAGHVAQNTDWPAVQTSLQKNIGLNPRFNPWLVLIGVCGTEFNRGLNFNPGLGDLTLG